MKVLEILNGIDQLKSIFDKDMAVKAAFNVSMTIHNIDTALQAYKESELKLYREHGKEVETESGGRKATAFVKPEDPEKRSALDAQLLELLDMEVDVKIHKIKIDDIKEPVKPKELHFIHWLFKEAEE